jgi:hypothetical protein
VTGFHAISEFTADDWARVVGIAMALTLVIAAMARRVSRFPRTAWPSLLWMALVWAAIIIAAAFAFQHYKPGAF